jgi:hypothetical protein
MRNHMLIHKLLHTLARQIEVVSELGDYDGIAAGNLALLRPGDRRHRRWLMRRWRRLTR